MKRRVEAMLARSWHPRPRRRIVVLCYHSVHPSLPFASATPELFRAHLQWLREHCEVVPLSEIPERAGRTRTARPVVAITFDDGYEDNYTHAFPLLKEAGLPATIFLATGLLAGDAGVIRTFCDLYAVAPAAIHGLSWAQVREMRRDGIEFGAHTHTHPNLTLVGPARAAMEIRTSKRVIEDRLEEAVRSFAYPFGKPGLHFDAGTTDTVSRLGFEHAVAIHYRGVHPGDDPLRIPRFAVTNDPVDILAAKVAGSLDVLGRWQEWAPLPLARLVAKDPSRIPEVRLRMRARAAEPLE